MRPTEKEKLDLFLATGDYSILSTVRKEARPKRNDPCPCGSNKKYKKCCLK